MSKLIEVIALETTISYRSTLYRLHYLRSEDEHEHKRVGELAASEGGQESLVWMKSVPVQGSDDVEHGTDDGFHDDCAAEEPPLLKHDGGIASRERQVHPEQQDQHLSWQTFRTIVNCVAIKDEIFIFNFALKWIGPKIPSFIMHTFELL